VSESHELGDHNLGVLISVLNRVVDDAVMAALAVEHPDVRRAHVAVFEMLDPGGSRVADLARRARMSRQAMGELVDDLQHLGYVQRRADPSDGRAKLVVLTEKGQAAAAQGIAAVVALEASWVTCLGDDTARLLREALVRLSLTFGREHIR
jgi:DNA-binding MarR family transcriptional regulator